MYFLIAIETSGPTTAKPIAIGMNPRTKMSAGFVMNDMKKRENRRKKMLIRSVFLMPIVSTTAPVSMPLIERSIDQTIMYEPAPKSLIPQSAVSQSVRVKFIAM